MKLLQIQYPLLAKYFMPELKKVQDIAIREKKSMGIKDEGDPGPENDDENDKKKTKKVAGKATHQWQGPKFCSDLYTHIKTEIQDEVDQSKQDMNRFTSKVAGMPNQRPGLIGLDEPNRIIQMVQSITDLQGFDYLVEWKQPDKVTDDQNHQNPESPIKQTLVVPSIVKGSHMVTEAPYLYRQFIESRYARNNLYNSIKHQL
jgi:hypothetical protein